MVIDVFDRDYETLKNYEMLLHQLHPKSELSFFAAVKLLQEGVKGKPPDVIFADADEASPERMMKELQKLAPNAKVIFTSASGYQAQDALNVGAAGYLTKPITKEKLRQALEPSLLSKIKQIFK